MNEIILIKNGELALKGLNRRSFEETLAKNIQRAAAPYGGVKVWRSQSTMFVTPLEGADVEEAVDAISKVFGIASLSRAAEVSKDMDVILPAVCEYLSDELKEAGSFKVNAKRADKKFPLKSPDICAAAGEYILDKFPHLTVDVHNPDLIVTVEIRDTSAYIHKQPIKGAGGLPVGTGGRACVMISGGIDISVGGVVALVSMSCAVYLDHKGGSIMGSILIALGIGIAFGLVQGFLVAFLDIQPFIVSLAGMFFARGMTTIVNTAPFNVEDEAFNALKLTRINVPFLGSVNKKGIYVPAYVEIGVIVALLIVVLLFVLTV